MTEEYVGDAKGLPPNERVKRIKQIQESYTKCREFADDKVQLAMQTYEMVMYSISKVCNFDCRCMLNSIKVV